MRNILKLDPADTKQQLCDAEVIRQQHFCSVLSPALSCTYSLWPGPAILGLYLLFFPSFFFPHIRFSKYRIYFGRTPWTEVQQPCAGCRTWHSHIYLNHPEVLQPPHALQLRGGRALGWTGGNQKVLGSSTSLPVFHHSSLSCFYTDTALCMTTGWPRKREIPH